MHALYCIAGPYSYDLTNPHFAPIPVALSLLYVDLWIMLLQIVGKEYGDAPAAGKDDYYELPRTRGMCKFTDRTGGISTSTLIRRIAERADEFIND